MSGFKLYSSFVSTQHLIGHIFAVIRVAVQANVTLFINHDYLETIDIATDRKVHL